jgi:hypothetical protein
VIRVCVDSGEGGTVRGMMGWVCEGDGEEPNKGELTIAVVPNELNGGGSDGGGRACNAVVRSAFRASCRSSSILWKLRSRESRSCCWLSSLVFIKPSCLVNWERVESKACSNNWCVFWIASSRSLEDRLEGLGGIECSNESTNDGFT